MEELHALALPCGDTDFFTTRSNVYSFVSPAVGHISDNVDRIVVQCFYPRSDADSTATTSRDKH